MSKAVQNIPDHLVYEMVEDRPIYYKGYMKHLEGELQLAEIMGSSKIQALIIAELIFLLRSYLGKEYYIFTNEIGLKFSKKSWRAADIAIIKKNRVEEIDNKYLSVPPDLVIEIDTKAELSQIENPLGYYHEKTDELIAFGVKQVVWIFTDTKKVMVANPDQKWSIYSWADEVSFMGDFKLKVEDLLV